uniref:Uncharacterized protein n=1 Tax=Arundo donax TaxID=35708 RepID=A0A0A8YPC3_ARUDO
MVFLLLMTKKNGFSYILTRNLALFHTSRRVHFLFYGKRRNISFAEVA